MKLDLMPLRARRVLLVGLIAVAWTPCIVASGLLYSANHHYPRGPMIPTGEYTESRRDGGTGGQEIHVEDIRGLDVPGWVKFFKQSGGTLLWMGLLFVDFLLSKPILDQWR